MKRTVLKPPGFDFAQVSIAKEYPLAYAMVMASGSGTGLALRRGAQVIFRTADVFMPSIWQRKPVSSVGLHPIATAGAGA